MILFALALLASPLAEAAAPTPALTSTAAPAVAVKSADTASKLVDDDDKVICHDDFATGSRLAIHKECHTKRVWYQMQTGQANYLDKVTRPVGPLIH